MQMQRHQVSPLVTVFIRSVYSNASRLLYHFKSQQNDSFFKTFKQYLYIMGLSRYSYLIKPNGKTQRLVHVRAV